MAIGTASAIGLGLSATSAGFSIFNSLGGGSDAQTAANNNSHLADLEMNKYQLNSALAEFEARRIRDVTALDADYLGFATERQASWLATQSKLNKSLMIAGDIGRYTSFSKQATEAKARSEDIKKAAEIQADNTEHTGARQSKVVATQTNLKRAMQQEDDAKKLGLVRASAGARMVAYSGSALDVLQHEEDMANARQVSIATLGGMQADDVQYDSKINANFIRQKASISAAAEVRQFADAPMDNPVLQAQLAAADISTARDIALVNEEGWRTAMKMKMDAATSINRAVMSVGSAQSSASASAGLSSAYSGMGGMDYSKAGSSLLTGASSIFREAKEGGLFTTTSKPVDALAGYSSSSPGYGFDLGSNLSPYVSAQNYSQFPAFDF